MRLERSIHYTSRKMVSLHDVENLFRNFLFHANDRDRTIAGLYQVLEGRKPLRGLAPMGFV